jgi:D-arabinose 1-dehydrogenase-like Zn-dependent alcohol dehydrogenase
LVPSHEGVGLVRLAATGRTPVLVGLPEDNVFPLPIFETVLRGIQVIGVLSGIVPARLVFDFR